MVAIRFILLPAAGCTNVCLIKGNRISSDKQDTFKFPLGNKWTIFVYFLKEKRHVILKVRLFIETKQHESLLAAGQLCEYNSRYPNFNLDALAKVEFMMKYIIY